MYADAAPIYYARGWSGVLPLPPGKKHPPPLGWTGSEARDPSLDLISEWQDAAASGNVGVRMPANVIGLDVDHYGDKHGLDTLLSAQEKWGDLPPTWVSTARPGGSGIRFYRVPDDLTFPGKLEVDGRSHVEIVQRAHRYAVVWPSVHPNGSVYLWYSPGGELAESPPRVNDLPELPEEWIHGLRDGAALMGLAGPKARLSDSQATDLLTSMNDAHGDPCDVLQERVAEAIGRLNDPGARHDSALFDSMAIVGYAHEGHRGVLAALEELSHAFLMTVGPDRGEDAAVAEFDRMLSGALGRLRGEPVQEDPCGEEDVFEADVQMALYKLRVREEAKIRYSNMLAGELTIPELVTTWEMAQRVDETVDWLVDGLIPRNSVIAWSAEKKTGKTTTIHKLIKAVLDEEKYLDQFQCHRPSGSVVLYDMEMSEGLLGHWLGRNGIARRENVYASSLRGRPTDLNVLNETHRKAIADSLKERKCKLLIIDPLGPYLRMLGADENDSTEAGRALDALIALKEEADIDTLIIPLHAGHGDKTRARGSSVLQDVPDVNVSLYKKSAESEVRNFSASGRDVDVDTISFTYSLETGEITILGSEETDKSRDDDILKILDVLESAPGLSQNNIAKAMQTVVIGCGKKRALSALKAAIDAGFVEAERMGEGTRSTIAHRLTEKGQTELDHARRVLGGEV